MKVPLRLIFDPTGGTCPRRHDSPPKLPEEPEAGLRDTLAGQVTVSRSATTVDRIRKGFCSVVGCRDTEFPRLCE